MNKTIVKT